jgi:hypothetical protein
VTPFNDPTQKVTPVDDVIGAERTPMAPVRRRPGRAIVGTLGGLAIGLLIATGAQQNSPESEATSSTISEPAAVTTVPTTTTTLAPSRLDILVDGYQGTLYLAGAVNQQGKLWRWESRTGTPLDLEVPNLMVSGSFNASGVRVAVETRSGVSTGGVLWVGTPGNQEPLAVDVATWTWHSSDPAQIAWIEDSGVNGEGSASIRTAILPIGAGLEVPLPEDLATLATTAAATPSITSFQLVEFDDDGFLLQTITEEGFTLIAVDNDGIEVGRMAARYLGRMPDGTVLVSQAGALSRASRTLLFASEYAFPSSNRMAAIATSPVGDRWAIWEIEEATGVAVPARLWIVEGEILFDTTLPSALRAVTWSHDGRWLIAAVGEPSFLSGFSSGTLWFIDTEDWSMHQVTAPGYAFGIAAGP